MNKGHVIKDIPVDKCYSDYLKDYLRICESKLPTLKDNKERYNVALENIANIKRHIKNGIPKDVQESIFVPVDISSLNDRNLI